jgi:hypothetical protein
VYERATAAIKIRRFDQVPQLEGRKTRFDAPFLQA